jgi:hypothetical protein
VSNLLRPTNSTPLHATYRKPKKRHVAPARPRVLHEEEPAPPIPILRKAMYAGIAAVLAYVIAEIVATSIYMASVPSVYWVFEDTGPSVRFDPRSGYRVKGEPTRVAKFTRSHELSRANVEYVGAVGGNELGFPDRDDFGPRRTDSKALRLAVMGDSFTGGDLPTHWPDRCEDEFAERGGKAELLNFSQSGFGLANWHRMITKILVAEQYEIDGIVFAVWGNDLARRFYVCDHGSGPVQMGGRVQSWTPEDYPLTRSEATRWMVPWEGHVVSKARFAASLDGDWSPPRPFKAFLASTAFERMLGPAENGGPVGATPPGRLRGELSDINRGRGRLVREIRDAARAMDVPVLVVKIPTIEELNGVPDTATDDDVRAFAEFVGAEVLDGMEAFGHLGVAQVRQCWHPRDLHWNQSGSDCFADWMAQKIDVWEKRNGVLERRSNILGDAR